MGMGSLKQAMALMTEDQGLVFDLHLCCNILKIPICDTSTNTTDLESFGVFFNCYQLNSESDESE